jgi:hypothetical protein
VDGGLQMERKTKKLTGNPLFKFSTWLNGGSCAPRDFPCLREGLSLSGSLERKEYSFKMHLLGTKRGRCDYIQSQSIEIQQPFN